MKSYKEFINENQQINLNNKKYKIKDPNNNVLIFVSPTKILNKLQNDTPQHDVRKEENQIGDRVEKAKKFIIDNWNSQNVVFEPSVVGMYKVAGSFSGEGNGITFKDGRHRILAAEQLGVPEVAIEIPKTQIDKFEEFKLKPKYFDDFE